MIVNRKEIKSRLMHGDLKKIAEKSGYSYQYVARFFNGKFKSENWEILAAAKEVVDENLKMAKKFNHPLDILDNEM